MSSHIDPSFDMDSILLRHFDGSAMKPPRPRPGFVGKDFAFEFGADAAEWTDLLNGYQLAFRCFSLMFPSLAAEASILYSCHLRIAWPQQRSADDLDLLASGTAAVCEQWGAMFCTAEAHRSDRLRLEFVFWTLQEEEPLRLQPQPGDVLFLLRSPGEAFLGGKLLAEEPAAFAELDEQLREHLIEAYLNPLPLLHTARLLRMASIPFRAFALQDGLAAAFAELQKLSFGVELAEWKPSPDLRQAAASVKQPLQALFFSSSDQQLLWLIAADKLAEVHQLIWTNLDGAILEIGRIADSEGIWSVDSWGNKTALDVSQL